MAERVRINQVGSLPIVQTNPPASAAANKLVHGLAAIVSIIETCRRLKIRVRDYLGSILLGLANLPASRIAEVTPTAWASRN